MQLSFLDGSFIHDFIYFFDKYSPRFEKLDVYDSDTVSKIQLWPLIIMNLFIEEWYIYTFMNLFSKTNLFV
jgi:hypothetical protein